MRQNSTSRSGIRLGFVPLADCAPLVMAQELGLFREYGLRVSLSRELGWASVRDKMVHGELEASQAVAGLPFGATLGLGCVPCECLTALVLNLHGDAITLSNTLWGRGVRDGQTLREVIDRSGSGKPLTFGVVHPVSSHHFLLRAWLRAAGIVPGREVRLVVVPPPQMAANLKAGNLDGFCAGEPWNSVAVRARAGWCAALSAELAPGHTEKVLMAGRDFAEARAEEHLALVAALLAACAFCDAPEHRERICDTLARPEYVGVPAALLRGAFGGEMDLGHGRVRTVSNFTLFHRDDANDPSLAKAAWVLAQLGKGGLGLDNSRLTPALGRRVFRWDLYDEAKKLVNSETASIYDHETELENQRAQV